MTLTQLEYILAVHEHRHFGKAAESCFVTQPTLSMQIQKLEDELQITIFDRSKSPIQTTEDGLMVIDQAGKIIKEQKRLFSLLAERGSEVKGDFRLAVIPTLSPFILPLFLESFVKAYPLVNLQIQEAKTEDIITMLKKDQIDAGLLVTPLNEGFIEERPLYYEPFYLFVNPSNHLSKKKAVTQDELDLNEIWLLNKGNCFREQVLNICSQKAIEDLDIRVRFESGNFETLKNMVIKSHGYTILPHMAVEELSKRLQKHIRPFKKPIPTREVSLVFSKDCLKSRIINALEEEILGSVPDEIREFQAKSQEVVDIN
ncbi:MAG: DNA-binding transcriptional regulator OxyR [Halobacteriovoraceae bacterium]|nr:DNA-binding transcriptional regulator OxyR [Halobacteriovoraceae bacterium]|tara:strand:+ start:1685 stop:2629 length:945 start_codon:yes stop_codon:yes gene_type:complete